MEYLLDREKIDKFINKNGKYTFKRRSITYVLPLPTREPERAKFERGFSAITGGVIRKVNEKDVHVSTSDDIIDDIIADGKFQDDESKTLFTHFLKDQVKELTEGKVTTLTQLGRIPLTDNVNERKGEIDLIRFFFDTFIRDNIDRLQTILQNHDDSDLITEILDLSTSDTANQKNSMTYYRCLFPQLREQFMRDLENLAKNPSFLAGHLSLLMVHYTFVAMSQLILQTNKLTGFNREELQPVYYLLEWEKAAKWRDSYRYGNKMLLGEMEGFFAHEHALNILGMNTFSTDRNQFYHDLKEKLSEAGPEAERQFIKSIYAWLSEVYHVKTNIVVEAYKVDKTLEMAFSDFIEAIKKGISNEVNSRYPKAFEAIISKFFRKHGGPLGTILSLSQEQLLMLVAVSITEDRIELKQLWKELERRGVWLDHHSKEEVVKVLDKLNYMEKKSDSGDAQYVKNVL
ncbi:DNA phosphorothioation-dependent restriction protein DptG [Oceanobacillus halophilus]|uniref:DNA phosphorothioation-dependent restriction protein DptG n=1 Tax=Oceanobacillus halophilus TaxID=930130 RepID=A0A494ZTX5_9BACI|nr:DNA phosphorothioation-dependent restriction protein DptG [Oceanobacillus halophilus]RKQ29340.1 DNA phosphorothioation-dependent restriction protein DptG [Oceanobacillus halophilus]